MRVGEAGSQASRGSAWIRSLPLMASGWPRRHSAGLYSCERRLLNRRLLAGYVELIQFASFYSRTRSKRQPISIPMAAYLCTDCIVFAMGLLQALPGNAPCRSGRLPPQAARPCSATLPRPSPRSAALSVQHLARQGASIEAGAGMNSCSCSVPSGTVIKTGQVGARAADTRR